MQSETDAKMPDSIGHHSADWNQIKGFVKWMQALTDRDNRWTH
jgi:hypothetical protein